MSLSHAYDILHSKKCSVLKDVTELNALEENCYVLVKFFENVLPSHGITGELQIPPHEMMSFKDKLCKQFGNKL